MRIPTSLSLVASTLNNSALLYPSNSTAPPRPGAFPNGSNASIPLFRTIIANGTDITSRFQTENAQFPPRSWLGFGLDMTTVTPGMSYWSISSSLLGGYTESKNSALISRFFPVGQC